MLGFATESRGKLQYQHKYHNSNYMHISVTHMVIISELHHSMYIQYQQHIACHDVVYDLQ